MLIVENTEENRTIRQVVSTMAIEDMYFDKEFISEIMKVNSGEKTAEQLIQEVVSEYVR